MDVANKPLPALVFEQAMFVERPDTAGRVEPLYLHVPRSTRRTGSKYCDKYQACDHPVFFVKSAEYEPGYKPPKPDKRGQQTQVPQRLVSRESLAATEGRSDYRTQHDGTDRVSLPTGKQPSSPPQKLWRAVFASR